MGMAEFEEKLRVLVEHAWDGEIKWPIVEAWLNNFTGEYLEKGEEKEYFLFFLTKFIYFSKPLMRQMLRALFRDHIKSPLCQRIRRNLGDTYKRSDIINLYEQEIRATRFVGMGNPAESGAHLLYYFRQINYLPKDFFVDMAGAFDKNFDPLKRETKTSPRDANVRRYVFFDDLVGSGSQAESYLSQLLKEVKKDNAHLDFRFISLFSTKQGLKVLNKPSLFNGKATCLFELDDSYKAFSDVSRYFASPPEWFDRDKLEGLTHCYGTKLYPRFPLGYKNGQLLLGFSHNTPDNTPPVFWCEGHRVPWHPVFIRYDKIYGG